MNKTSCDTDFRRMMIHLLDDDYGISYLAWCELCGVAENSGVPITDIQRQIKVVEGRVFLKYRKNRV